MKQFIPYWLRVAIFIITLVSLVALARAMLHKQVAVLSSSAVLLRLLFLTCVFSGLLRSERERLLRDSLGFYAFGYTSLYLFCFFGRTTLLSANGVLHEMLLNLPFLLSFTLSWWDRTVWNSRIAATAAACWSVWRNRHLSSARGVDVC